MPPIAVLFGLNLVDELDRLAGELTEFVAKLDARNAGFRSIVHELTTLGVTDTTGDGPEQIAIPYASVDVQIGAIRLERFDTARLVAEIAHRALLSSDDQGLGNWDGIRSASGLGTLTMAAAEARGAEQNDLWGESNTLQRRAARIAAELGTTDADAA